MVVATEGGGGGAQSPMDEESGESESDADTDGPPPRTRRRTASSAATAWPLATQMAGPAGHGRAQLGPPAVALARGEHVAWQWPATDVVDAVGAAASRYGDVRGARGVGHGLRR